MSIPPTADQPAPFPSIATPTSTGGEPQPKTYDDIVRKTVPMPDSSHRPFTTEEIAAEIPREPEVTATGGANAFPNQAAIRDALQALSGVDVADLQVDVAGGSATMVGSVARSSDRDRITTALGKVPGVVEVIDRLRIRLE